MSHVQRTDLPAPPEPKVVGPDYVQSFDNLSAEDFMKIYLETLRYQDPFRQQDISKSIEDVVRLNQIKFYTDMKFFMDSFTTWMNQITFLQTINLIGKDFVFSADVLNPADGTEYYIVAGERVAGVKVQIYDGDELVKEIEMDLERGLNPLDLSDLPAGQYTVRITKDDFEVSGVQLGFKDRVKSVGIIGGELMLELESGRQVSAGRIIYVGV
jgi:flagellar basal-body rod modification protein FlgD